MLRLILYTYVDVSRANVVSSAGHLFVLRLSARRQGGLRWNFFAAAPHESDFHRERARGLRHTRARAYETRNKSKTASNYARENQIGTFVHNGEKLFE